MPRKPSPYVARKELTAALEKIEILESEVRSLQYRLSSNESLRDKLSANVKDSQSALDISEGKNREMVMSIEAISASILEYGQPQKPRAIMDRTGRPAIAEPSEPVPLERQLGRIEGLLHGFVQKYKEPSKEYGVPK